MATIRDVAKACGLSVSTVSIVLNGKARERKIPPATAQRVREAAALLHYRPNRAAQALRGVARRPVVALFWVLDGRSTFFMRLVRGIEEVFSQPDCPCDLVVHPYVNGHLQDAERLLLCGDYQAILFGALGESDIAYLEALDIHTPVYLINRSSERFPFCTTDPRQIGELIADYAAQRGCRRLAVVADREAVVPKTTRREAVLAACKRRGIDCGENLFFPAHNAVSGGIEAARALLDMPDRPDLVFADDDMMALGFCLGLRMQGRDDLPILCIALNDPDIARHMTPALSFIDIPGEWIGRESARQISALLYGKREAMERIVCDCGIAE